MTIKSLTLNHPATDTSNRYDRIYHIAVVGDMKAKLLAILESVRGESPPWGPKLSPTAYKKLLAEIMLLLEKGSTDE